MSFKLPNIISQCITCFFLFLFSFFLFLFNYYYYFYYFIRAPCVVVNYIWPKWIVLDHTNTIDYILCTTSFPSHSWTQKKKKLKKKKKRFGEWDTQRILRCLDFVFHYFLSSHHVCHEDPECYISY